jgi:hypothetical protein
MTTRKKIVLTGIVLPTVYFEIGLWITTHDIVLSEFFQVNLIVLAALALVVLIACLSFLVVYGGEL